MDSDTLEQARRYCDDAFKLLADEIAVLRKDAWLLNRRLEQIENVRCKGVSCKGVTSLLYSLSKRIYGLHPVCKERNDDGW